VLDRLTEKYEACNSLVDVVAKKYLQPPHNEDAPNSNNNVENELCEQRVEVSSFDLEEGCLDSEEGQFSASINIIDIDREFFERLVAVSSSSTNLISAQEQSVSSDDEAIDEDVSDLKEEQVSSPSSSANVDGVSSEQPVGTPSSTTNVVAVRNRICEDEEYHTDF